MTALNDAAAVYVGTLAVDAIYRGTTMVWPFSGEPVDAATVTIPAGKVASTLTDFVTRVDLSDMPQGWWYDVASDGGNIRVKQAGSVIPFDLVNIAPGLNVGELFFKATLNSGSDNVFTIDKTGAALLPATDTNGRNAVWSGYDDAWIGGNVSRTGSGRDLTLASGAMWSDYVPTAKSPHVNAHQGVTRDPDGNWYIVGTTDIKKYDPAWNLLVTHSNATTSSGIAGVNHLGDGLVYNGELYIGLEEYPNSPSFDNQHIGVYALSDLSFVRSYDLSGNGHYTAGVTRDPATGHWWVATYNTVASTTGHIYEYDETFTLIGGLTTSAALVSLQGIEFHDGDLYVTSDTEGSTASGRPGRVLRVTTAGAATELWRGVLSYQIEGIYAEADGTFQILWDQEASADSRVYTFSRAPSRWLCLGNGGTATSLSPPTRTQWTMGAASVLGRRWDGPGQIVLAYGTTAAAATAYLGQRSTGKYGLWNSVDAWLEDTGHTPALGERKRMHHTQNGTTDRKFWRDGTNAQTDPGVAQRPTSPNRVMVGGDPSNATQAWRGQINYAYLRNGVLSADWLAAEYASWETPSSFYTVA